MDYKTKIKNIKESCNIIKIDDDARIYATSQIINNFKESDIVFIAKNQLEVEKIKKQLIFFNPGIENSHQISTFYPWDCRPYDNNQVKSAISTSRIKTLHQISHNKQKKHLVITTINNLIQKIPDKSTIQKSSLIIKNKDKISSEQIIEALVYNGYTRQSLAYIAGEFSVRGGIIDIVTSLAGENIGYRIDLFGDEIESIKSFDVASQLSQDSLHKIEILPAGEIILNDANINNFRTNYRQTFSSSFNLQNKDEIYESVSNKRYIPGLDHYLPLFFDKPLTNIFSYLSSPTIFLSQEVENIAQDFYQQIESSYQDRKEELKFNQDDLSPRKPLPTNLLYYKPQEIFDIIEKNQNIKFHNFEHLDKNSRIIDLEFKSIPQFHVAAKTKKQDPLELATNYIKDANKKAIITVSNENSKNRIKNLLIDLNKDLPILEIELNSGFETSDLIMISESSIFGEKINRKRARKNIDAAKKILEEGIAIDIGELIVHREHGIGKFEGIQKIKIGDIENDMIKIAYAGSDNLFISVEDIDLITRYSEANPLIQLDKLGVASWKNRKAKIKKRIQISAKQLIEVAAQRQLKKGKIFIAHEHFYEEFKANFGFVETDDQLTAIESIEDDLSKGVPMDRLICGDVGFGKTEVAMRAAFIVASTNYDYDEYLEKITSGKSTKIKRKNKISQIAIITPTTILCRQHYNNFKERFKNTPFKITSLSRLTTQTKNRKTKEQLESGEIDIIIGTHALLSKNIKFKNLSLLIVDEEQHFGVAQKERLKELKNNVHILTLSATPIPRTLQMSLTGIKDLSLIATPPIDRLSVRNFVAPFDITTAKEAIIREYQRGGKVFFVTPFIKHIADLKKKLNQVLPEEIKLVEAHGQMTPNEIENIMNDFYDDKIDVLLSTTIIESGIDVASANTIIINKAEMFGLSQLYQLRGRVGRSKKQAYAYFMTSRKEINEQAKRKLKVMQNLDELGVGFSVASHDMDIRGSGDLIGDEQSGHIKETGIELYQQMLFEEIEKVKSKVDSSQITKTDFEFNPQIKLSISLAIPESYICDLSVRMSFYKKIAKITNQEELNEIEDELLDRFGSIPEETRNLTQVALLKNICKKLGISKLQSSNDEILISFKGNKFSKTDELLNLIFKSPALIKILPDHRVSFSRKFLFKEATTLSNPNLKIKASFKALETLKNL